MTGDPRRILVVWNPAAGEKAGIATNRTSIEDVHRVMEANGLGDEVFESPSEAAAGERVDAAIRDGYDVVIAAGGDGTVRSVALRLLERETALGILPLGSAMNLARSLGIPRELEPAAAIVAAGHVRTIDVGRVRDRTFVEQVTVGLSAEAFGEAQQIDRRRWSAAVRLLGLLLRRERTRIDLDVDGERSHTHALALSIANTPYTGMGIELAPDARLDDGLLDVVIYEGVSALGLARYMAATFGGRGRAPERFRTLRARHVRVQAHRARAVRFDAEDAGETPVEISVRPGVLRVVAPIPDNPDNEERAG
ncbi:MAG TPA: diacylglycerol kinase family protein [Candidatus Limnocylindrales bacterium]